MKTPLDATVYKINFTILIIPFILDLFHLPGYHNIAYIIMPWGFISTALISYNYYKTKQLTINFDFFIQLILCILAILQLCRFLNS